jgi:hypothetical protein
LAYGILVGNQGAIRAVYYKTANQNPVLKVGLPVPKKSLANSSATLKAPVSTEVQPSTPTRFFRCTHLNFASYVLSADLLRYDAAELAPNGRDIEFRFYDPDARGPDLLRRYTSGAAELVNARTLYEMRGYLVSEVKRIQASAGVQSAQR